MTTTTSENYIDRSEPAVLLRPCEVAERLSISRSAAYSLLADGSIPTVRIGRSVRVPAMALNDFVERLLGEPRR